MVFVCDVVFLAERKNKDRGNDGIRYAYALAVTML
jgi:hypothetical protein